MGMGQGRGSTRTRLASRLGVAGLFTISAMVVSVAGVIVSEGPAAATTGGPKPVVSSTAVLNRGGSQLHHLSCASSTRCVALTTDSSGKPAYRVYGGSSWSATSPVGDPNPIESLSCAPSSTFCMAVDAANQAIELNGSTWSTPTTIESTARSLDSVSCASATFCLAVDTVAGSNPGCSSACINAFKFSGGTWSGATDTALHLPSNGDSGSDVSCPTTTFCMLTNRVSGTGSYVVYNGTTFSTPKTTESNGLLSRLTCASSLLCMANPGGLSQGQPPVVWDGLSWTASTANIAPTVESCAMGTTFCVAGGDVTGSEIDTYSAGTWKQVNTNPDLDAGEFGTGVVVGEFSCTSATFCLGVDTIGNYFRYSGSSFSAPIPVGSTGGLEHVSCSQATFCVATDQWGRTFTFNGTAWSAGLATYPTQPLSDLSCAPSTKFCVGVNFNAVYTFNGTSWSAPSNRGVGGNVSCATATFCVAVGGSSYQRFNGASWSASATFDGGGSADGVSCPSTTFCVATDTGGQVFTFNGSSWTDGPTLAMPGLGSGNAPDISCTSSTFCVAVDTSGHMSTFDGIGWTTPVSIGGAGLTVGCAPATRTCLAVDGSGHTYVHAGNAWTGPTALDAGNGVTGTACASTALCLVIDQADPYPSGHALSVGLETVPGAPTIGAVTGGSGQASLSWTAPTSNGGSAITGYVVTPYIGATPQAAHTFNSTATTETVTGLTNGTTYTFKVAAKNAIGTGAQSATSNTITPAPYAPFASWSAFVTRQYLDLTTHTPTSSSLSSWVAQLTSGTKTKGDLDDALRRGAENLGNVDPVVRVYRAFLGRAPDAAGLKFWIARKRNVAPARTWSVTQIAESFTASNEFMTKYGSMTNMQFVTQIYTDVLGRAADPSGVTFWTNQLNTKEKDRAQVVIGFSESNEYKTKQAQNTDVAVAYIYLLGRAPTAIETTNWTTPEKAGTTDAALLTELLNGAPYATHIAG